jgi:hypothetical protein
VTSGWVAAMSGRWRAMLADGEAELIRQGLFRR